jgi:transposase
MQVARLLPDKKRVRIEGIEVDESAQKIRVNAYSCGKRARCPRCGRGSSRVHSRYTRFLADLPWSTFSIELKLQVRRFRCGNKQCPQQIFAERLPSMTSAWSRKTNRLADRQRPIGLLVGSSAGTRICQWVGIPLSIDSLLRSMRHYEPAPTVTPRVLGVDDWAKRRGRTYGTILVDLETHRPIELLPDREASTLTRWLRDHPGVQIISRDRAGAYAEGAKQGAPEAVQVADRWHLLKNLMDALSRCLEHHRRQLKALSPVTPGNPVVSTDTCQSETEGSAIVIEPTPATLGMKETLRQLKRDTRYTRYNEVRQAQERGLTISAIARITGLDRKTVRKYAYATEFPEQAPRGGKRHGSKLDPFKTYLLQRWQEGCHTGRVLWRELCQAGYVGGFTLINDFLRQLRRSQDIPPRTRMVVASTSIALTPCPVTPRSLAAAIVAHPDKRNADQNHWLNQSYGETR